MKNKVIYLYCSILALLCQALAFSAPVSALDTNNFYFKNATFDYYLEKTDSGTSRMRVVETLTAVFPIYDQNHGITREIPFTNQNGKNITISSLDLTVTRNGEQEPFTYDRESDYYFIKIGSANSYIHGEQTYELSYYFENVITDFDSYQELYWDTNGTGWQQPFYSLTATIHFQDQALYNTFSGNSWCYVGRYGASDQSSCQTTKDNQNLLVTFTAYNLASEENLTFDLEFKPESFVVPTPRVSYVLVFLAGVIVFVIIYSIFAFYNKSRIFQPLRKLYKNTPVVPQFTPPKNLSVAEAASLLIDAPKRGSAQVATLISLAVNHHVNLKKTNKKLLGGFNWEIELVSIDNISDQELLTLKILNGSNNSLNNGDIIKIKNHSYASSLANLSHRFDISVEKSLQNSGLFKKTASTFPISTILIWFALIFMSSFLISSAESFVGYVLLESFIPLMSLACFAVGFGIIFTAIFFNKKFRNKTESAIIISRYLDGLYYYMNLAEADRIKFLQSLDAVDTSPNGIVTLYEKLLPYAIIFGIETSWVKELNHYYELTDTTSPTWFYGGPLVASDFHSFTTTTSSHISSSTTSSSSSGGGGGGFSGGGGGGGGGGGW